MEDDDVREEVKLQASEIEEHDLHFWSLDVASPCAAHLFHGLQVASVAIGESHCILLTKERSVYSLGSNRFGQLGVGDFYERETPTAVGVLPSSVVGVACGARHSGAVCENGQLFTWGDSRQAQCGHTKKVSFMEPTPVHFSGNEQPTEHHSAWRSKSSHIKIKSIACGELHTLALDSSGHVWSWGTGPALGLGIAIDEATSPQLIASLKHKRVVLITSGSHHCAIITQDDFHCGQVRHGATPSTSSDTDTISSHSTLSRITTLPLGRDRTKSDKIPFQQSVFYDIQDSQDNEKNDDVGASQPETSTPNSDKDVAAEMAERDKDSAVSEESNLPATTSSSSCDTILQEQSSSTSSSVENSTTRPDVSNECDLTQGLDSEESFAVPLLTDNKGKGRSEESPYLQKRSYKGDTSSCEDIFHSALDLNAGEDDDSLSRDDSEDEAGNTNTVQLRRQQFDSTWSVMSVMDPVEIERIGCSVPVSGSTEVLTWGKNSKGQLGLADIKTRYSPVPVKELANRGVITLVAGCNHTLALTSFAEVWSWGDNAKGQCAHSKSVVTQPRIIRALCDVLVWDAAAGKDFSLFIADARTSKAELYFCGASEKKCQSALSVPVVAGVTAAKRQERRWRRLSQRPKRNSDGTLPSSAVDVEIRRVVHFNDEDVLRRVSAGQRQFACFTSRDAWVQALYNFASSERRYFCSLSLVDSALMHPLCSTEFWTSTLDRPGGEGLVPLIDSFADLLNSIATGLSQLTELLVHGYPLKDLFSFLLADSFRAVYERYSKCYTNVVAVGLMQLCSKQAGGLVSKSRGLLKHMASDFELEYLDLAGILRIPLRRSMFYCDAVRHLIPHAQTGVEREQLYEVISRWQAYTNENSKRLKEALVTKTFWEEWPAKLTDSLKDPQRRVVKTSKADPLSLARASRLASHSYILFNDVFVHQQFNRSFQVFPLVTLWAEPVDDFEGLHNAFKLTSPEQSYVVMAGTPSGKVEWLRQINCAVAMCLSANSSVGLNISAVNATSGTLKAAVAREAEYTFLNHARFKGATYKGMWLNGLPHGRGRISWPDGISYEGEFVNGSFHGCGVHTRPYTSSDGMQMTQRYQGEWFEGKIEGYGTMRYGKDGEYSGHWRNDARNGHGTMKSTDGNAALRTIYMGNWVNDHMCGYGVLDNIIRGEKYLGSWVNNQRHGYGIVVTVDGVYYEGKFIQNRLVGRGLLLSDDDTCYQGEFTADMMLSGKGILTLPNGDFIDGTFNGRWGDGIKVNGIFSKFANQSMHASEEQPSTQDLTNFTIPAASKWKSLFDECRSLLGYHGHVHPDVGTVWDSITDSVERANSLTTSQSQSRPSMPRNSYRGLLTKPDGVTNELQSVQSYLLQAFSTVGHPFHVLLNGLVEAYRGTYVGVGAHRRLLPHAVDEAKSYVARLYSIIRLVFPDLPDEEFVHLSSNPALDDCHEHVNSHSLLHPLLLPSIYPPLFTLYALHTEKSDTVYIERLHQLNKRGDKALLSFLGVTRKFWLCHHEIEASEEDETATVAPYATSVDALGYISTMYSPMEKVNAIKDCFRCMNEEVRVFWSGKQKLLSMDDIFPVFQFVVVRARIPHLGSEIQFIEDLIDPDVEVGELGHMITTLKACYYQIQNERDKD